ncbi:FlxA-like protein [Desulfonatronum thiosulfatophilum]|uniref:FlxA-like protein n=1 Tax=Desulfonatronum thiosulfatophilum TaxID=617002 RepID=A0A1G6AXF2_9BACT|nr:FlxA-like family protein [Desulfonatronum thiosulfatophilum]SDB13081.1 FlxA-like protein [Desulfonatronum thiosulfatophilum]
MRIDGYREIWKMEEVVNRSLHDRAGSAGEQRSAPTSWGSDAVTISPAARDAQSALRKDEETDGDNTAAEAFKAYMDKTRGGSGSSGDSPIEALKARLKDLENKLASIAASPTMQEQTKNSMMQAIQAEITQVTAQIAELEAQAAEGSGKK